MVINQSISISQTPESIWSYWIDVANDVHWRDGIVKAEWTSEPPFGVGSKGEHTHKNVGVMKWEVTRLEHGSSFEFVHTAGALKGSIAVFQVKPEGQGSRVNVQMNMSGPLAFRIMMVFMGGVMRRGVHDDLQKLKEIMERQEIEQPS